MTQRSMADAIDRAEDELFTPPRRLHTRLGTIHLPLDCDHEVSIDLIYRRDRSIVIIEHNGLRAECPPRLRAIEQIEEWLEEQHG